MAIRFVVKPKPQPVPEAVSVAAEVPKEEPKKTSGKKFTLKAGSPSQVMQTVTGFQVLPTADLSEIMGARKFLVHRVKAGVWYEILRYDGDGPQPCLKLRSPRGLVFDSKPDITTAKKYAVVVGPMGLAEPSKQVMELVRAASGATPAAYTGAAQGV